MKKRLLKINRQEPVRQLCQKDIKPIRDKILKEQGGTCAICGNVPKVACLDHAHTKRLKLSGKIRGVCCSACNIFLAKAENNAVRYGVTIKNLPTILRSMANYLEKKEYPYRHPSEKPKAKLLTKTSYKKLVKILLENKYSRKVPEYPKSGKLTKGLKELYSQVNLPPDFYKK